MSRVFGSLDENSTSSEKELFRILPQIINGKNDLVWYEPALLQHEPDFLVYSEDLGFFCIEVKDWLPRYFQIINTDQVRKIDPKTSVESYEKHPLQQANGIRGRIRGHNINYLNIGKRIC